MVKKALQKRKKIEIEIKNSIVEVRNILNDVDELLTNMIVSILHELLVGFKNVFQK